MAYFDTENLKKIKGLKREVILPFLRVAIILALALAVAAIVFFQETQKVKEVKEIKKEQGREGARELTDEEKINILEGLASPPGASQYTDKEKRQILKALSATQGSSPVLSEDEKKALLDSLSAPSK